MRATLTLSSIDWQYSNEIDINQLWAEVYAAWQRRARPQLTSEERKALEARQSTHKTENPLEDALLHHFDIDAENHELKCHTATIVEVLRGAGVPSWP